MQGDMTTGGTAGSHPACAACKHQRKKCTKECILAPYFPAERTREFQAVHKYFGVSNVTKIVKTLTKEERKKAVDSLVWEASWRQKDPVLGPYGEYIKIFDELRLYKRQNQNQVMQLPGQWGVPCKGAGSCLVEWNGAIGINSKAQSIGGVIGNTMNCTPQDGNIGIVDSNPYGSYPLAYGDKPTQELKDGSGIQLQEQNSIGGFSGGFSQQTYYVPGKSFLES
ncbi:LOB domain-containing protein 2 [Morella rubra]|uniref:LOB domain-containing protein 2 n=1 Tax=Morella rubra TaxID=262757 RepID=A0A6A1VUC1_9ROSI|nr:LOB domain-containing protein 2 [Morella rubra]